MKRFLIAGLFPVLWSPIVAMGQDLESQNVSSFTDSALEEMLHDFGYSEVTVGEESESGNGNLVFMLEGTKVVLYNYADGDLQLYWGVRHEGCGLEVVNEWNRTRDSPGPISTVRAIQSSRRTSSQMPASAGIWSGNSSLFSR